MTGAATKLNRKWTRAEIESCKMKKGGFSRSSFKKMGISWPPKKGWRKALLAGKPIPGPETSRRREGVDSTESDSFSLKSNDGAATAPSYTETKRCARARRLGLPPSYKVAGKETTERRASLVGALDDLPGAIRAVFLERLRAVSSGLSDSELWNNYVRAPDKYFPPEIWSPSSKPRRRTKRPGPRKGPKRTGRVIQDHAANHQNRFEREWSEAAACRKLANQLDP